MAGQPTELKRAVAAAHVRLRALKARYPQLKAWLVLARREQQVDLRSDLPTMLTTFPDLFAPTRERRAAEAIARQINLEQDYRRCDETGGGLTPLAESLKLAEDVLVELRFDELNYALIALLRKDDLVDRDLTPQSAASIRIVLGTAWSMARTG